MGKQTRLEALKLAVHGEWKTPQQVIEVADTYFDYIEEGQKVVELDPRKRKRRQRALE
jgi:hypothetical protein